jgi:hypothetical protein
MQNFDHNIGFWEKRPFFRRKLSKIAENCDHNIGPRSHCFGALEYKKTRRTKSGQKTDSKKVAKIFFDLPPIHSFNAVESLPNIELVRWTHRRKRKISERFKQFFVLLFLKVRVVILTDCYIFCWHYLKQEMSWNF